MTDDFDNLKVFQIFRAGTHVDGHGTMATMTPDDLRLMAVAYNAHSKEHGTAPLYSGHPAASSKEYGRVLGLVARDDKLFAAAIATPELISMVRMGSFDSVSASFAQPHDKNNPYPGVYYLLHVGFLGKYNSMRPAVKNMDALNFMEGEALPVYFRDNREYLYFSEMNALSSRENAVKHELVCEFSRGCGVDYGTALTITTDLLWRH